jgi:hypothetical protein
MTTTSTDAPEGLDLRKDGTVWLHLDDDRDGHEGKTLLVKLRRPKMKELRQFRQDLWDIQAEIAAFSDPLQEKLEALYAEHEIDPLDAKTMGNVSTAVLHQVREITRERDQQGTLLAEGLRLPWAAEVIGKLSTHQVDEDDLPGWCSTVGFASALVGHWLAVPTRRGGQ